MANPDFALIAELMLRSYGFQSCRVLSKKIASMVDLCDGLLSSQPHYEFGLRYPCINVPEAVISHVNRFVMSGQVYHFHSEVCWRAQENQSGWGWTLLGVPSSSNCQVLRAFAARPENVQGDPGQGFPSMSPWSIARWCSQKCHWRAVQRVWPWRNSTLFVQGPTGKGMMFAMQLCNFY